MKKRLLSLLLICCITIGLFPMAAMAADPPANPPPAENPAATWFGDQLGGTAKKLYSAFENLAKLDDFTAGTASVDLIAQEFISADELTAYIGGDSALAKAFQDARDAFFQDHPELFYIDITKLTLRVGTQDGKNVAYINNGPNASYLDALYAGKSAVTAEIEAVNTAKEAIVAEIRDKKNAADKGGTGDLSAAEIVTLVHNKVVEQFDYKYPSETEKQVTGVSSLVTKVANCQGYAKTVKWILDELNIPSVLVQGAAQNSGGVIEQHMWNYVCVDGAWYAVDATWDDPITAPKTLRYTYLLQGSGLMAANHAPSGQLSPGGMTFVYPEISDLSYDIVISAVLNDLDSELKIYTQRVVYEQVESTKYMITYKGAELKTVTGNQPKFYLAARFAYKDKNTGELQKFKPWVDLSAYSIDWDDEKNFLSLAFTQPGSIQFCITDKPMGKDENGKSRLCYAEDLSLEGNHIELSKPLLVPYYSDYVAPPHIRTSKPVLTQRIQPVKTQYRVEYTEELKVADANQPIGFTIKNTSDLSGQEDTSIEASYENLTISSGSYTTPDGETHKSSILTFDFIPDKTYQGYSVYYSLTPSNLVSAESGETPNPVNISTTFDMRAPCPILAAQCGIKDAFVLAYPSLIASGSSDAFIEKESQKPVNSMDIRLVATIPNQDEADKMLESTPDKNTLASSVYELTLACKSLLAALRPDSGLYDVTVGLPYPPGFNYKENQKVTFKAYHYVKQSDGSYKTEELVCRVTELGLQVIVNSFSPFSVVAVPEEQGATTAKFVTVDQKTGGGKITTTDDTNTSSVAGLFAFKTGDTKSFSIVPDTGYVIDKVLLNGETVQDSTSVAFSFDSMKAENTLEVFFIAETVKAQEQDQNITIVAPKLTPVALGDVQVSLTAGDGKLTLSKPEADGTYYYKTSLSTEIGAKPAVGDKADTSKWKPLSGETELALNAGTEFFVQVIRVEKDGVAAWGEASATPKKSLETLSPFVTAGSEKLTLASPSAGNDTVYYYQTAASAGNAPALDSAVDTAKWTVLSGGQSKELIWDGTATYVRLLKARDGKVIGWGETFVEGKAPVTPPPTPPSGNTGSETTPAPLPPVVGQTATVTATAKVSGGAASVELKSADISAAIAQLKKADVEEGRITVSVAAPKADSLSASLPAKVCTALLEANIASFSLESPLMNISLNREALKALQSQSAQDATLAIAPVEVDDPAIGDRPAYEITANVDGKPVFDFGDGRLTLDIPYQATGSEDRALLCAVYVDENGRSNWLPLSHYDTEAGVMRMITGHLSTYAVGLRPVAAFADTGDHWAESGIRFAAARGIFSGTGDGLFNPDVPVTRGMFVTVLGRIAGVDADKYKTESFHDVPADSYYAPYVEWAKAEHITSGAGDDSFAPDRAITRQEMALIMSSFMKAFGTSCPDVNAAVAYADSPSIASWAVDAVAQMQTSGLLNGVGDGCFAPTGTATRGESAVLLRRFIELAVG